MKPDMTMSRPITWNYTKQFASLNLTVGEQNSNDSKVSRGGGGGGVSQRWFGKLYKDICKLESQREQKIESKVTREGR